MVQVQKLGVAEGELVLVDANALVYYVEGAQASGRRAAIAAFVDLARSGGIRLSVSALAWTELLSRPIAAGALALADSYRRLLADSSLVRVEPVDVAIAEEAARLMASRRRPALELADAIHVATAIVLGAGAVLTNDGAWRGVPGCPRVLLVDEIAAELDFSEAR